MRLPVICLFDKVGIRSHQLINKRTPFFGTVLIEIVFVSMSGVMRAVLGLLLISLGLSCWSLLNSLHQASSPHPDTRSSAAVAFHQTSVESSPAGIDLRGVPPRLDVDRLRLLGIESPERIRAVPIREIEVGMRVPAHNPQRSDAERAADDLGIDPATWRKFTLDVEKSDGSGIVTVTLLRPATWLVAEREATELALLELAIEHEVTELIEHWASLPYWARTWYQLHEWVSVDSWLDSVAETLVQTWSWGDRCWRVLASGDLASGFIRLGAGEWIQSVHEEIVADWEYEQSFVSAVGEVQSGAGVDSYVWVDLPELGAEGLGRVVANEACPLVLPGPGQVVTGTFVHRSADVLDLVFAPSSQFSTDSRLFPGGSLAVAGFESDRPRFQTAATTQTIGVTPVHPFWSVTRDEFVPAGELVLGEEGVTIDGQIWRLTSITPRAGPE
ncbi:MAG TPA: hypothetical protein PKA76_19830, partial [Pirellulaceae bacterium]|nr:hypothetical protein [Pirellulaceae bacterium]